MRISPPTQCSGLRFGNKSDFTDVYGPPPGLEGTPLWTPNAQAEAEAQGARVTAKPGSTRDTLVGQPATGQKPIRRPAPSLAGTPLEGLFLPSAIEPPPGPKRLFLAG